ncbi:putative magnesium transporter NIPA4 [Vitis vinifera]|uniref:Probable magnesium transporter n=1 Tax=Vitis vinifera TaxID=29760 RepID=A0A438CPK5_VITVI|nr:putative magnesium transporter NIPA4 [Vitis vinifera]
MAAAGEEGAYSYKGMSADNIKGLVLALSSSFFIGASFIVKKKGLKKAGASGIRAGVGGYSYLYEPLWWVGMITMIVGEIANFAAYAFAPAILVTPLGALSIIIRHDSKEKLHIFGILGCVLCVVGSTTIVLHAPQEREIQSVIEVWDLATEPAFLFYAALVITAVFVLIIHFIPQYGQTHIMVYIGVCSLVGSLSVMSVKALGIALKLTLSGMNQLTYPQTWAFTIVSEVLEARFKVLAETGRSLELEEKRKMLDLEVEFGFLLDLALDTFNTAVVSPIYYVMFTSLTILASVIMFKNSSYYFINSFLLLLLFFPLPLEYNSMDWDRQNPTQIVTEMCGFVTILSGTFLLHKTKDLSDGLSTSLSMRLSKHIEEDGFGQEGIPLRRQESLRLP